MVVRNDEMPADIERACVLEVLERVKAFERGELETVCGEEALREIRGPV